MKFTLLIPTKNEIDGLRVMAPRINKAWVDQIVVVDGHSTDGTQEFARQMGYTVIEQKNHGRYGYYGEALPHCTGDVIVTFSPDGNSIPELIPVLVEKMREGFDMVIASRYYGTAKSEDDTVLTSFGNFLFTKMINILFGGSYTDTLVIFRAFRKDLGAPFISLPEFDARACIIGARDHWKVMDIAGDEPKRIGGESKMQPMFNGFGILKTITSEYFNQFKKNKVTGSLR